MSSASRPNRREFLRASVGLGAMSLVAVRARGQATTEQLPLKVGAAAREITPPLEVGILMSSGRRLWEPFEGVRLPLFASAVVVERDRRRIALVALDLLGLADEAVGGMARFRERVVAAAGHAVRADDLVLASSHTHSGPASIALTELHHTDAFKQWVSHLAEMIGAAVRDAAQSTQPCRLMVGRRPAPGLAVNRRIKTTTGIVSVRRQLPPDVVIGPEGPVDDELRVAAFVDGRGKPVAILVNFTAHPVLEMCIKQVSPDYPGEMSRQLRKQHPGAVVLFFQGACGNINPPTMPRSAANAEEYGRNLAELVDKALAQLHQSEGGTAALRWKTVQLPARDLSGELEEEPLKTRIGAARIGDAAFVFLPGEPFVEIALEIRRASPWEFTAVVGYADDYIGYIPTDRAFENGGYEIGPGRWSRVASGSEPIVRREAIRLLESLR